MAPRLAFVVTAARVARSYRNSQSNVIRARTAWASGTVLHGRRSLSVRAVPVPVPTYGASGTRMVAAAPQLKERNVGDVVSGFQLKREEFVREVASVVRVWEHSKTRTELVSVLNDDENKTFGVVFRTPPSDSTGVPHILEHSVLCGSRKYPVKEPFVELMKSSLNTFLNAFTYPDKTCYPVASCNERDFYN
eukprot:IDg10030t1